MAGAGATGRFAPRPIKTQAIREPRMVALVRLFLKVARHWA